MIRKAVMLDLDALVDIENRAFMGNRLSRRSLRTMIANPKALMLIVVKEGQVAGYGLLLYRKGSDTARLYSFATHPDFRGHGLSVALMEQLESQSAKPIIRLEVRADNIPAIQLYKRLAFNQIGYRENYYEDGQTALIMEKKLTQ